MRKLTIQEIIKLLPIETAIKNKLLAEYESYDDSSKSEIIHICYGAFFELEQAIRDSLYKQYMEEAAAGTRTLGASLHDDIEKATWAEIEARINGKQEEQDELHQVRKQLEKIMDPTEN